MFDKFSKSALNICMHVCTAEIIRRYIPEVGTAYLTSRAELHFRRNDVFFSDTNKQGCNNCT